MIYRATNILTLVTVEKKWVSGSRALAWVKKKEMPELKGMYECKGRGGTLIFLKCAVLKKVKNWFPLKNGTFKSLMTANINAFYLSLFSLIPWRNHTVGIFQFMIL